MLFSTKFRDHKGIFLTTALVGLLGTFYTFRDIYYDVSRNSRVVLVEATNSESLKALEEENKKTESEKQKVEVLISSFHDQTLDIFISNRTLNIFDIQMIELSIILKLNDEDYHVGYLLYENHLRDRFVTQGEQKYIKFLNFGGKIIKEDDKYPFEISNLLTNLSKGEKYPDLSKIRVTCIASKPTMQDDGYARLEYLFDDANCRQILSTEVFRELLNL